MQKKSAKKKYVLVGTGSRASMYVNALMRDYTDVGELSAFCDSNQARMDYWNSVVTEEYKNMGYALYTTGYSILR